MKTICLYAIILVLMSGGVQAACMDEVKEQGHETLRSYVATITSQAPDLTAFGKDLAQTLLSIANCDGALMPEMPTDRRGYYQALFIVMQYIGVKDAVSRPSLKSADDAYNRYIQAQRAKK